MFPQPDNPNGVLWRYMDLSKLISLLNRSELFLTQIGSLEDPFEGHYPARAREKMDNIHKEICNKNQARLPSGKSVADFTTEFMRSSVYVNCWCLQEHESEAMWRIYGKSSGVAVRTEYKKLADALSEEVFIGKVTYIDPNYQDFPTNNALALSMFKRHFYQHEAECRIVKWLPSVVPPEEIISDYKQYPRGVPIKINIKNTINDIITSPLAPSWFYECVAAVAERFASGVPVVKSIMCP